MPVEAQHFKDWWLRRTGTDKQALRAKLRVLISATRLDSEVLRGRHNDGGVLQFGMAARGPIERDVITAVCGSEL